MLFSEPFTSFQVCIYIQNSCFSLQVFPAPTLVSLTLINVPREDRSRAPRSTFSPPFSLFYSSFFVTFFNFSSSFFQLRQQLYTSPLSVSRWVVVSNQHSFEACELVQLFFVHFFNFCLTYPYQRPPCGPQSGTEKYEEGKSIFSFLNIVVMLHACYHSLHMYQQIQFAEKCCYGDHIILVITYISKVLTTLVPELLLLCSLYHMLSNL